MKLTMNSHAFFEGIDRTVTASETRARDFCVAVAIEAGQNLVVGGEYAPGTPVDTGRARGAWQLTLGERPRSTPVSPIGRDPMALALRGLSAFKLGMKLFWTNNVVYIERLEFGHSQRQAPHGMLRLVEAAAPRLVAKVARLMGMR